MPFRAGDGDRFAACSSENRTTGALNTPVRRYVSRGFALHAEGVEIAVVSSGMIFGRLVVESDLTNAVTLDQRIAAVILANALFRTLEKEAAHSNN